MVAPALVAAVFLVAGVAHLLTTWEPYGDWAVAELIVRHTSRYLPLSGPYSAQRGYNHPLPLVYALQWLPYRVFGEWSSAGLAISIWWNGAWLTLLTWLLARSKAPWLAVAALITVPIMAGKTVAGSLMLPWNPSLALIPGLVLVFVAWRVATGSRRLLPVAAGLAVWCTGAHLGFAPFALGLSVVALAGLVFTTMHRGGRTALTALRRPVTLALGVALVLAAPLLVDLAANGRASNPVQIVEKGRPEPGAVPLPKAEVLKVLRAELAIPPAWASTTPPYNFILNTRAPQIPILIPLGLAVALAAWRRRATDELVGMGLSVVGLLGATAGLLNIGSEQIQPWYLLPGHAASMALFAFIVWSGGRSVAAVIESRRAGSPTGETTATRLRSAAMPAVCFIAALLVVPSLRLQPASSTISKPVAGLAAAVEAQFEPGDRLIVDGPISIDGYYSQALALKLDRAGFDVRVPDDQVYLYSPALEIPSGWTGTRILVQLSSGPLEAPEPGARLIRREPIPNLLLADTDTVSVWKQAPGV